MPAPRPRTVTLACLYAGLGAAFLFLTLVTALGNWGSVQMQDQIEPLLEEPPLSTTAMSVDTVLAVLRWLLLGGVVASIATMVFAVFAFRGDRGSRIGLTVLCGLAALVFVTMGIVGILPAVLAAMCVGLLWQRDSRRFFAGEEPPVELGAAPSAQGRQAPPAQGPPAPGPAAPPAGGQAPAALPPYQAARPHWSPATRRPRSVTASLLVAGIGSALVAGFGALTLLMMLTTGRGEIERAWNEQGQLRDLIEASGFTIDDLVRLTIASAAVWVVLSVLGLVATLWAASRRTRGARVVLVVVSALTIAASMVFFPVGIPWTIAAIVVIILVSRAEARAWYHST